MRIDYNEYPIIRDIENGTLDTVSHLCSSDTFGFDLCKNLLSKVWSAVAPRIRANICIPCEPYIEAIEKSSPCFDKLISNIFGEKTIHPRDWVDPQEAAPLTDEQKKKEEEMYKLIGDSFGCYLLKGRQAIIYGCTWDEGIKCDFVVESLDKYIVRAYVQVGEDYAYFVTNSDIISSAYKKISDYSIGIISQLQHERNMIVMFERYAKVETRYIQPKARVRIDLKSLVTSTNETRLKIHIRDSRYFTNIIRKEGFLVRGHLRLQNKKVNGEWTKELIYIDAFEKHGYHRQATLNNK